jgi:membrane peptidoglycan carboxypeptidase
LVFKLSKRRVLVATAAIGIVILTLTALWVAPHARRIHRLRQGVGDTVFYSADGRPWFSMDDRRQDVSLAEISPHLRRAVIAVADRRFFHHYGIDLFAVSRAVVQNARHGAGSRAPARSLSNLRGPCSCRIDARSVGSSRRPRSP